MECLIGVGNNLHYAKVVSNDKKSVKVEFENPHMIIDIDNRLFDMISKDVETRPSDYIVYRLKDKECVDKILYREGEKYHTANSGIAIPINECMSLKEWRNSLWYMSNARLCFNNDPLSEDHIINVIVYIGTEKDFCTCIQIISKNMFRVIRVPRVELIPPNYSEPLFHDEIAKYDINMNMLFHKLFKTLEYKIHVLDYDEIKNKRNKERKRLLPPYFIIFTIIFFLLLTKIEKIW